MSPATVGGPHQVNRLLIGVTQPAGRLLVLRREQRYQQRRERTLCTSATLPLRRCSRSTVTSSAISLAKRADCQLNERCCDNDTARSGNTAVVRQVGVHNLDIDSRQNRVA